MVASSEEVQEESSELLLGNLTEEQREELTEEFLEQLLTRLNCRKIFEINFDQFLGGKSTGFQKKVAGGTSRKISERIFAIIL